MKRRTFLTVTGTIGIAGAVSGATVVSSVYSSVSANLLIGEFSAPTKNAFDNFIENVAQNAQETEIDEKFIQQTVTPVQIINKKFDGNNHSIVFKNKCHLL